MIETSIVSYLTARLSRDLALAQYQLLTRRWWRRRTSFSLFVSQIVLDEAMAGDPSAASGRLRALREVPVLDLSPRAKELARELVQQSALPHKATVDAFHIAIAADAQLDYLLTWNCKHLANIRMRGKIDNICRSEGLVPPVICTPEELLHWSWV